MRNGKDRERDKADYVPVIMPLIRFPGINSDEPSGCGGHHTEILVRS
jgi:hypothetical protein